MRKDILNFCITFAGIQMKLKIMFEEISIRHFRGIRNTKIEGINQVNLLFGKNNCGKSSVLEAIFLISGFSNPLLPVSINMLRNYNKYAIDDLSLDFYNLDTDHLIELSATGSSNRSLVISPIQSVSNNVSLESLASGNSDNVQKHYGLKLLYKYGKENTTYHSEFIIDGEDTEDNQVRRDKRYEEKLKAMYIPASYMSVPVNESFAQIVKEKKENEIITILKVLDPRIIDMQLVNKELLVDIGLPHRLSINVMGDGMRKLISIVLSVYSCKNGILMIDEIDNGFHYTAMPLLWKALLTAAKANNTQVFVTSHNIDSLRGLSKVLEEDDNDHLRSLVAAHKLVNDATGNLQSFRYDYKTFDYSIKQELEIR